MAFSWLKGKTPIQKEYPTVAEETYTLGEALVLSNGAVTKCSATTKPEFISMNKDVTGGEGVEIAVQVIEEDMEFRVPLSAAGTGLKLGDKVTLNTDGAQVTATKTSGVAEIIGIEGTAIGDTVIVKF